MDISRLTKRFWHALAVLSLGIFLVGCSGLFGGNTPGTNSSAQPVALSQLHWCNSGLDATFMDDAASATPQAANSYPVAASVSSVAIPAPASGIPISWSVFKANLGFPIFLPATLPSGSCLLK